MAHSHSHAADSRVTLGRIAAGAVFGLLAAFGVAVAVGAVILWPRQQKVDIPVPLQNAAGGAVTTVAGRVLSSRPGYCGSPSAGQVVTTAPAPAPSGGAHCSEVMIGIESGPKTGAATLLEFGQGSGQPALAAGERVRVIRQVDQ